MLLLGTPLLAALGLMLATLMPNPQRQGMMPEVVVRPIPSDTLPTVLVTAPRPEPGRSDSEYLENISLITLLPKGATR